MSHAKHARGRAGAPLQVGDTLRKRVAPSPSLDGAADEYAVQLAALFRTVVELCFKNQDRLAVLGAARRQWADLGAAAQRQLDPDLVRPAWEVAHGAAPPAGDGDGDGDAPAHVRMPRGFETSDGVVFTLAEGMDAVTAASSTLRAVGSMQYFSHKL